VSEPAARVETAGAAPARRLAPRGRALPNGWWGMALLVATEATLFGTVLATYYYLRFKTVTWPPAGIEPPDVALPLALSAGLVATSAPLLLAARFARADERGRTIALVLVALLVQAGYLAVQVVLFGRDLGDFSPRDSAYGSVYFSMLALHHAHVALGLLLELGLLALLARGLSRHRAVGVRTVALYWHFVNAMAILVVLTQLSPSL
jgi:heme/copper-type cytochrome/quinol oxidase subunit 3